MHRNLTNINRKTNWNCSYKTTKILLLLAALKLSACATNRKEGSCPQENNLNQAIDIPNKAQHKDQHKDQPLLAFNKLQEATTNIVSQQIAGSDFQSALFKAAIKKCDVTLTQCLLNNDVILTQCLLNNKENHLINSFKHSIYSVLMTGLIYRDTLLSCRYKHKEIVKLLLSSKILSAKDLGKYDKKNGTTLLHEAIKRGDIDSVESLVLKLSLEHLCQKDKEGRKPMNLIIDHKRKKMFNILFDRIRELDSNCVINQLFELDEKGYPIINHSYLPNDKKVSALFNNMHRIKLPIYYKKGTEMFEHILNKLLDNLKDDKFVTTEEIIDKFVLIAKTIEDMVKNKVIRNGDATKLRRILKDCLNNKYGAYFTEQVAQKRNTEVS